MTDQNSPEQEAPFVSHLMELRDRLLRMVVVVSLVFLSLIYFANDIYTFVADPLIKVMPAGTGMIATEVLSPFLTPFKLTLVVSVFVSMPYLLYQLWAFVAPGLYRHERRMALPLVASSILLFYAGAAFAYFVVFKLVFGFLVQILPQGVSMMTDIRAYLDFVLRMFFAFGLAFEVPIAIIILVWMGMTTPQQLAAKRPYVVVGAFVIGMLLTPPDIISQTLLALPMWLLFEAGLIFSRMFVRQAEADADDEPDAAPTMAAATAVAGTGSDAPVDEGRFVPMTPEEMDAELDTIEAQDAEAQPAPAEPDDRHARVEAKLQRVQELREAMEFDAMRRLLYEVLVEGDEGQIQVARDILAQLDDPT